MNNSPEVNLNTNKQTILINLCISLYCFQRAKFALYLFLLILGVYVMLFLIPEQPCEGKKLY